MVYDNDCLTLLLNSEHATKYVIVYTYPNKFIRDNIVPTFAPTTIVNVTLPTIGCCLAAGLGRRLGLELDLVSVDGREMNSNHIYICLTIKQKYTAQNGKDNINVIEHSPGCLSGCLTPVSDRYSLLFCSTADPDVTWPDRSSRGRQTTWLYTRICTIFSCHCHTAVIRLTPGFQRYVAVLRIRFRNHFRKNRGVLPFRKRRCRMPLPFTTEKANGRVELSVARQAQ